MNGESHDLSVVKGGVCAPRSPKEKRGVFRSIESLDVRLSSLIVSVMGKIERSLVGEAGPFKSISDPPP